MNAEEKPKTISEMFKNITEKYDEGDRRIKVLEAYEGEITLYFDRSAFRTKTEILTTVFKGYISKTLSFLSADFERAGYGIVKIFYNPLNTTAEEVSGLIKALINYLYTVENTILENLEEEEDG